MVSLIGYADSFRKFTSALSIFPFLWVMTGLFWFPKGASYMGLICIVSVILASAKYKSLVLLHNIENNRFIWILGAVFVYVVLMYLYHGHSSREMKALFFSCLFLLFFPMSKLSLKCFIGFIVAGVFGACITAIYQYGFLGVSRIHGFINPITYAVFSGLCMIQLFSLFLLESNKTRKVISLILSILALLVIASTGARGVLLGVVFAILVIFGVYAITLRNKGLVGLPLILICVSSLVYFHPGFQSRVEKTQREIELIKEGNYSSSIGLRLQVWKSAYYSGLKKPLLGFGDAYIKEFEQQGQQGLISKRLYELRFSHYHNQFIDKYMKTGLIGLFLFLLILVYPLLKAIQAPGCTFPKISIVGILCMIAVSGLTDVPLNHAPIIYCYLLTVSYLLHLLKKSEECDGDTV